MPVLDRGRDHGDRDVRLPAVAVSAWPWWVIALLCLACCGLGGLIVYVLMLRYLSRGLRG
jgi:hypothetical protein